MLKPSKRWFLLSIFHDSLPFHPFFPFSLPLNSQALQTTKTTTGSRLNWIFSCFLLLSSGSWLYSRRPLSPSVRWQKLLSFVERSNSLHTTKPGLYERALKARSSRFVDSVKRDKLGRKNILLVKNPQTSLRKSIFLCFTASHLLWSTWMKTCQWMLIKVSLSIPFTCFAVNTFFSLSHSLSLLHSIERPAVKFILNGG